MIIKTQHKHIVEFQDLQDGEFFVIPSSNSICQKRYPFRFETTSTIMNTIIFKSAKYGTYSDYIEPNRKVIPIEVELHWSYKYDTCN